MASPNNAKKFIEKRRNSNAKKLFLKVLGYFSFSYHQILKDKIQYSETFCKNNTAYAFEDYLKIRLVNDYLQNRKNKLNYKDNDILLLTFQYETEKEYRINNQLKSDKIDIFISNLGLNWLDITSENLYFVAECKRLKNRGKSNAYLSDTQKFVEREYTSFRFPFNGMIGFVEKSSIKMTDIIKDLEKRLISHKVIQSKKVNNKILNDFAIKDFDLARLAKHIHNTTQQEIEVYHLFLDYSEIITK